MPKKKLFEKIRTSNEKYFRLIDSTEINPFWVLLRDQEGSYFFDNILDTDLKRQITAIAGSSWNGPMQKAKHK
jgi:hypothetical protein